VIHQFLLSLIPEFRCSKGADSSAIEISKQLA